MCLLNLMSALKEGPLFSQPPTPLVLEPGLHLQCDRFPGSLALDPECPPGSSGKDLLNNVIFKVELNRIAHVH